MFFVILCNILERINSPHKNAKHSPMMKQLVIHLATRFKVGIAAYISAMVGGPKQRQIYRYIVPKVKVDCFLGRIRLNSHLLQLKKFIDKLISINNLPPGTVIPVEASIDSTPVSGRIKPVIYSGQETALVGFNHALTTPVILDPLDKAPDNPALSFNNSNVIINGVQNIRTVIEQKLLTHASEYHTLLLIPGV